MKQSFTTTLGKVLLALFAFVSSVSSYASTVRFDFTTGYTDQQKVSTVTNGPVTVSFGQGASNNAPVWLVSTSCLRLYAKNTMSVSSSAAITGLTITFSEEARTFTNGTKAAPTVSAGTYTETGVTGTWAPNGATAFNLTAGGTSGHARITAVTVEVEGETQTVVNPVISPASAKFAQQQQVEISCDDSEAEIHYTTDGSTPSAQSSTYTAPLTITQTTELKAIAVKGDLTSSVVTAQFTKTYGVASIAEYLASPSDLEMIFTNAVVVTATNSDKHLFVEDGTGAMLIFGTTGQSYSSGDIIPAGFVGTKTAYAGEYELSVYAATSQFQPADGKADIMPMPITTNEVATTYFAEYVVLKNATITSNDGANTSLTLTDDYGEAMGFTSTFGILPPDDLSMKYDITGIVSSHGNGINTIWQLLPLAYTPCGDTVPVHGDVNNDGQVTAADVTAAYDVILGGNEQLKERADVNGDGEVTVADVTEIYGIVLGAN